MEYIDKSYFDKVPKTLRYTNDLVKNLKAAKTGSVFTYGENLVQELGKVYHQKCAYCESKLEKDNFSNSIDHYRPSSHYFWLKYEWSNLLPCCRECSRSKRNRFPLFDETLRLYGSQEDTKEWRADSATLIAEQALLLHPALDVPEEHLWIDLDGVIYPANASLKGVATIDSLALNTNNLVYRRKQTIQSILQLRNSFSDEELIAITEDKISKHEEFTLALKGVLAYLKGEKTTQTGECFITRLDINIPFLKCSPVNIELNKRSKKHLILTGKNGSGKTSVINSLKDFLSSCVFDKTDLGQAVYVYEKNAVMESKNHHVYTHLNTPYKNLIQQFTNHSFFIIHFGALRTFPYLQNGGLENGVDISYKGVDTQEYSVNQQLFKYLIKLETLRLFTKENNKQEAEKIIDWYQQLNKILQKVLSDASAKIGFDRNGIDLIPYIHTVQHKENKLEFRNLPDGYNAILTIILEIVLRLRYAKVSFEEARGIILIDEVDIHLHPELQKEIMPVLTSFFPNMQFIVTTHSPFVINSIEDAVIYDLENQQRLENVTALSYDALLKGYMSIPKTHANIMEDKLSRYEELAGLNDYTEEQADLLADLDIELEEDLPRFSPELYLRFKNAKKLILND